MSEFNEMPSRRHLAAAKRNVLRGWRGFWEKRGIDPNHIGRENGFRDTISRRKKRSAAHTDEDEDYLD